MKERTSQKENEKKKKKWKKKWKKNKAKSNNILLPISFHLSTKHFHHFAYFFTARAIELDPNELSYHYELGTTLRNLRRHSEALKLLTKVFENEEKRKRKEKTS